jgi:hypothetical protein
MMARAGAAGAAGPGPGLPDEESDLSLWEINHETGRARYGEEGTWEGMYNGDRADDLQRVSAMVDMETKGKGVFNLKESASDTDTKTVTWTLSNDDDAQKPLHLAWLKSKNVQTQFKSLFKKKVSSEDGGSDGRENFEIDTCILSGTRRMAGDVFPTQIEVCDGEKKKIFYLGSDVNPQYIRFYRIIERLYPSVESHEGVNTLRPMDQRQAFSRPAGAAGAAGTRQEGPVAGDSSSGPSGLICPGCGQTFSAIDDLSAHYKEGHGGEPVLSSAWKPNVRKAMIDAYMNPQDRFLAKWPQGPAAEGPAAEEPAAEEPAAEEPAAEEPASEMDTGARANAEIARLNQLGDEAEAAGNMRGATTYWREALSHLAPASASAGD